MWAAPLVHKHFPHTQHITASEFYVFVNQVRYYSRYFNCYESEVNSIIVMRVSEEEEWRRGGEGCAGGFYLHFLKYFLEKTPSFNHMTSLLPPCLENPETRPKNPNSSVFINYHTVLTYVHCHTLCFYRSSPG